MFTKTPTEYLALKFFLDNEEILYFSDRRGLARIRTLTQQEFEADVTLKAHKVDGLSSSKEEILAQLQNLKNRGIKKELKPFLLDYHNICGIGNIYGSEICYEMKLSPKTKFCDLTDEQLVRLATVIQVILKRAYAAGGSSIESFINIDEEIGSAQKYHKVYQKDICSDCGARIISFKQDGRTTFYCPVCQGGGEHT